MKILYIHQYFKTPLEGGSVRSYYLSKGLVEAGNEVVVITSWNRSHRELRWVDGIKVYYLPVHYDNRLGFKARILAFLKFFALSLKYIYRERSFDKAYVMTTPLSTGMHALFIRFLLSKPYLFEVGDLWPEVPIQMGYIKYYFLKKVLYAFEKYCYKNADAVVALSSGIAKYISDKVPGKRVETIPNIADLDFFQPSETSYAKAHGVFTIAYFGTAGAANHLEFLVNAATACEKEKLPVQFIVQVDGSESKKIENMARGLANINFLPWGNKEVVRRMLLNVDAVYLSFHHHEALGTGSPNKFFDGLAAGKLIITNFKGWIKDLIEKEDCGFYYDPFHPDSFVAYLKDWLKKPEKISRAQQNSRSLADQFSKEKAINKLINLLADQKPNV